MKAIGPVAATALGGAAYLLAEPATADMAAHVFRTELWAREGFTEVNPQWYGGHHVPAYSLLFPPLGAALGPRLVGVLAAVAAVALFASLARTHAPTPAAARLAAWLFAAGALSNVVIGRMPFTLGLALGVAAWWCAERRTTGRGGLWPAAALSLACAWASPVAGLFLVLAAAARGASTSAHGDRPGRWTAAALAPAAALAVPATAGALGVAALYPEGGTERFVATAFWPMLAVCAAALALVDPRRRAIRIGGALYLALLAAAFALPNPLGQNALRLGVVLGPALLALAAGPRVPRPALLAAGLALVYLQWLPAVRAVAEASGDPSVRRDFHAELVRVLEPRLEPGERVEVVFTHNHWEAAFVAPAVPLARGWERQVDRKVNALFYDEERPLTHLRYRAWLRRMCVRYVALPAAPLDYSAEAEARLLRRGDAGYLTLVHASPRWRIWRVAPMTPLSPTCERV